MSFAVAALSIGVAAPLARAQVTQTLYRADDGTGYQILRATSANVRITTVAGSSTDQNGCSFAGGGAIANIYGAGSGPDGSLHPYDLISRTAILTPNDGTLSFDAQYGGRVALGTGGSILNVCASSFDCTSQANVQSIFALDSSAGGVPPACLAQQVSASCDSIDRQLYGFGLSSTNPPLCDSSPTVNTTQCAATPSDGFTLNQGEAIVFTYSGDAGNALNVSYTQFTLAPTGGSGGCAATEVTGGGASGVGLPAPPAPTPTPTPTCGDGSVNQPSEQCDGGQCCTGSCTFASSSVSCNDSNVCTTSDHCDGSGACVGGACAVGTSCTDACGSSSQCQSSGGSCVCP